MFFSAIVFLAVAFAGGRQLGLLDNPSGAQPMAELSSAMVDSAGSAVELAIGLVGVMTLFLGLMKVVEEGGMLKIISRLIRPPHDSALSRCPPGSSGHGGHDPEPFGQCPGPGQCRHPLRHQGHAGPGYPESRQGPCHQCHGPVFSHQHLFGHPVAHRR